MKYLKYLIVTMILLSSSFSYGWSQDGNVVGGFYPTSFSGQVNSYIAEPAKQGLTQTNGILVEYRDPDTQVFGNDENMDRTISNAMYIAASGSDTNGNLVDSGKDIHGVMSVAVAKTTKWGNRGVSAFGGTAIQAGSGVATNEFFSVQPDWSVAAALQLVGVFAVVKPDYADCGNRDYTALQCVNAGSKQAQNGVSVYGNFNTGINLSGVNCKRAGIVLSSKTIQGSIIEYGQATYTYFNGGYTFTINGKVVGRITSNPTNDSDVVTIGYLKEHGFIMDNGDYEAPPVLAPLPAPPIVVPEPLPAPDTSIPIKKATPPEEDCEFFI